MMKHRNKTRVKRELEVLRRLDEPDQKTHNARSLTLMDLIVNDTNEINNTNSTAVALKVYHLICLFFKTRVI